MGVSMDHRRLKTIPLLIFTFLPSLLPRLKLSSYIVKGKNFQNN